MNIPENTTFKFNTVFLDGKISTSLGIMPKIKTISGNGRILGLELNLPTNYTFKDISGVWCEGTKLNPDDVYAGEAIWVWPVVQAQSSSFSNIEVLSNGKFITVAGKGDNITHCGVSTIRAYKASLANQNLFLANLQFNCLFSRGVINAPAKIFLYLADDINNIQIKKQDLSPALAINGTNLSSTILLGIETETYSSNKIQLTICPYGEESIILNNSFAFTLDICAFENL